MDGDDFGDLLARATAGEARAWATIHDTIAPVVYGYLRSQALDDPDDVAGETLLQVVRDLSTFDGSEAKFRSWALAIAHHRMLDARRARARRPFVPRATEELPEDPSPDDTPDGALEDEEWRTVQRHLAALTDEQRAVVTLRVVGELSLEETAAVLDRTVGAVKALQHRAFAALRERLSPRNPAPLPDAHSAWPR